MRHSRYRPEKTSASKQQVKALLIRRKLMKEPTRRRKISAPRRFNGPAPLALRELFAG